MKILIAYATGHGTTKQCAEKLASYYGDSAEVVNLDELQDKENSIDLDLYDAVIIGGPIYRGKIKGSVKKYVTKYERELLQKRLGLFITCMEEGEKAEKQLKKNYPENLVDHAEILGSLGGAIDGSKLNPFTRLVMKVVGKIRGKDLTHFSSLSDERLFDYIHQLQDSKQK